MQAFIWEEYGGVWGLLSGRLGRIVVGGYIWWCGRYAVLDRMDLGLGLPDSKDDWRFLIM